MSARTFKWIHLSDLHVGMRDQSWLWPNLKHLFFDDLRQLHQSVGNWQLVLFSGDLVQKGDSGEFDRLDEILSELWSTFRELGFNPSLLFIPGNHDLKRTTASDPDALLLNDWWEKESVRKGFFDDKGNRYRKYVDRLFRNYSAWSERMKQGNIPVLKTRPGILPGDQAACIEHDELKIGIVCLNSTWLQIGPDNYRGRLHVDPKQLLIVTDTDPTSWCRRNDLNVLVTHQPVDWLHQRSQSYWSSDINPPGRFDIHLFGHMHESASTSHSVGGSIARNSFQAPSMFGLEYVDDQIRERIHGYSASQFKAENVSRAILVWPRTLHNLKSGEKRLGPDLSFSLDHTNAFKIALPNSFQSDQPEPVASDSTLNATVKFKIVESSEVLNKVEFHLPNSRAHENVRRVEQKQAIAALESSRVVWLIADWGLAADSFIGALRSKRGHGTARAFRIDFSGFTNLEQFLNSVRQVTSCSFERLCEILSDAGQAYLIFDDVLVSPNSPSEGLPIASQIQEISKIVGEYCPDLSIIVRSRRMPLGLDHVCVQLKPLDEADLKTFVSEHEKGGPEYASPEGIGILFRHTDGVPARIESALIDLDLVGLSDLVHTNSDISAESTVGDEAPKELIRAIRDLKNASDPNLQRSFDLLKALSLFPQGEQLGRIRRFHGVHGFHPTHARLLMEHDLVERSTLVGMQVGGGDQAKTLVVPRIIREQVREEMTGTELHDLTRKAADLYFGPGWSHGSIKSPPVYRFSNPHRTYEDIANANTIVLRLLKDAQIAEDESATNSALTLALSYIGTLISGDHYRSVVSLCEDLTSLLPHEGFSTLTDSIKRQYGKALRMTGEHSRSKEMLEEVDSSSMSTADKQSILLNIALCYESLKEKDKATEAAKSCVDLDRHSYQGLQARGVILGLELSGADREQKLVRLEATARRKGAAVVANNIAITRSEDARPDRKREREILETVLSSSGADKDFYNGIRAMTRICEINLESGGQLSENDQSKLIEAYHFLFSERLPGIFDRCHSALWNSFASRNDMDNLLSLFRHSSLVWRLKGNLRQERKYANLMTKIIQLNLVKNIRRVEREISYYLARAGAVSLIENASETTAESNS